MPTKRNSAGEQQSYIPAGNGEASGQFTGSQNIGYHYGDLGKADYKNIMSGRNTGHYGTGTYFFGSRDSSGAEWYRKNRPINAKNAHMEKN